MTRMRKAMAKEKTSYSGVGIILDYTLVVVARVERVGRLSELRLSRWTSSKGNASAARNLRADQVDKLRV